MRMLTDVVRTAKGRLLRAFAYYYQPPMLAPACTARKSRVCLRASERPTEGRLHAYGECRPRVYGGQRQLKEAVYTGHGVRREAHETVTFRRPKAPTSHVAWLMALAATPREGHS